MLKKDMEDLEKTIRNCESQLRSFKQIIDAAKPHYYHSTEKLGDQTKVASAYKNMVALANSLAKEKKEAEEKLAELKRAQEAELATRKPKIAVMYFQASNGGFDHDEVKFVAKSLRKFELNPFELDDIDFGMSDDALFYASQQVARKEAQEIWRQLMQSDFADCGELLYWDGVEILKN